MNFGAVPSVLAAKRGVARLVYMYVIGACMCVCICIFMYVCMCVCTKVYTHTQGRAWQAEAAGRVQHLFLGTPEGEAAEALLPG